MNLKRRVRELEIFILILTMKLFVLALVVLMITVKLYGQEPSDAVGWALTDIATVPEPDRPFTRYLWIPPYGNERWVAATSFTVNSTASQARTIIPATVLANGWLVKYDLRRLAPNAAQLAKLIETWDGLAVDDPYFHVPSSNTNIKVAIIAPHLPQDQAALLTGLSLSTGAIYRADWFMVKALSTVDGGRYYDFRQVERKPAKGTQLDNWLSSRGLFVGTTEAVGGERRAAMFRSNVTGKPRRIDVFPTLTGGVGSITRDINDGVVAADAHPIRSLLDMKFNGSEVIVAMPNGLLDYLLTDANGNIVDEAPPELVRDHTIPAPHTSRLQPGISCIRCHGVEKADGWQPITNDVAKVLGSRLNIFADVSKNLTPEQVADKLAGFYALDVDAPDGLIGRGRRDYSTAMFRVAQGIKFEEQSIVAGISKEVSGIYGRYLWELITPNIAALELGGKVDSTLDSVLGPVDVNIPVDPVLGFLRIGVPVNRTDWESIYADTMAQVRKGMK